MDLWIYFYLASVSGWQLVLFAGYGHTTQNITQRNIHLKIKKRHFLSHNNLKETTITSRFFPSVGNNREFTTNWYTNLCLHMTFFFLKKINSLHITCFRITYPSRIKKQSVRSNFERVFSTILNPLQQTSKPQIPLDISHGNQQAQPDMPTIFIASNNKWFNF